MKKLIFSLTFLLILVFSVQAQIEKRLNTGNVSMYLCKDYSETDDITGLFTGFTRTGNQNFNVVARIQDFAPNVVHQLQIKIINPAKKNILESKKQPFILKSNMNVNTHIEEITATFDMGGAHQVQIWIDDKLVQYLNFDVGDHIPQNYGKGNVAMVVCRSYDSQNKNINQMYTGVRGAGDTELLLLVRFQDFPLNVANKAIVKLITPAGQDLLGKKEFSVIHGSGISIFNYTSNITVEFPEPGVYQFQVEVNGKIVQYLNFSVVD